MNTFEWHGPGYNLLTREESIGDLAATVLDHLHAIACQTDNLVEVRYGESGKRYGISKHSKPEDLRDIAAKLIEAEESDRTDSD